jgi:hypothetical protein
MTGDYASGLNFSGDNMEYSADVGFEVGKMWVAVLS